MLHNNGVYCYQKCILKPFVGYITTQSAEQKYQQQQVKITKETST